MQPGELVEQNAYTAGALVACVMLWFPERLSLHFRPQRASFSLRKLYTTFVASTPRWLWSTPHSILLMKRDMIKCLLPFILFLHSSYRNRANKSEDFSGKFRDYYCSAYWLVGIRIRIKL
jgi:hypothetical protein